MARSHVGREMVKLGGQPELRQGFTTDNGNLILDVYGLSILDPLELGDRDQQYHRRGHQRLVRPPRRRRAAARHRGRGQDDGEKIALPREVTNLSQLHASLPV